MFEHESLNGEKARVVDAIQSFIKPEVLETRDSAGDTSPRLQHAVAGSVLVERYLPAVNAGDVWPHDSFAEPWWVVVDHPPHAGLVADFNEALGGTYKRKLDPAKNVVAYAEQGEEVVMNTGVYSVTRASDSKQFSAGSLLDLRKSYYTE